jgi:hypothetical protein
MSPRDSQTSHPFLHMKLMLLCTSAAHAADPTGAAEAAGCCCAVLTAVLNWLSVKGYQLSSFSTWPWLPWCVRWLMRQPGAATAGPHHRQRETVSKTVDIHACMRKLLHAGCLSHAKQNAGNSSAKPLSLFPMST